ncbi:MAG: hypothetical protein ACP5JU_03990, partial [Minisyncoccia bacterium]
MPKEKILFEYLKFKENPNKYIYLIFLILSFLFTSLNQGGQFIIHWIDISWSFNPSDDLYKLLFLWNSNDYGYISILNIFNLPAILAELILNELMLPTFLQQIFLISILEFIASSFYFKIFSEYLFNKYEFIYKKYIIASSVIFITLGPGNFYLWDFIPQGLLLI